MAIRRSKMLAVIPLSSMADIAFLLLIFFMVTSVLKVDSDVPLVLPDAKGSELSDDKVNISIGSDRHYYFNNEALVLPAILARVQAELSVKPDQKVLIHAHDQLEFELVHLLLDGLKQIGAKNIAFVTKQNERKL